MTTNCIELPTQEFVGALNDVIPFASTEKDDPAYSVVRLEWDGSGTMYLLASNRHQHVRYEVDGSSWQVEPSVHPFSVRVPLSDVKMLASAFKLPTKHAYAPVSLQASVADQNFYRLTCSREGTGDYSRLSLNVFGRGRPVLDEDPPEVDIHEMLNLFEKDLGGRQVSGWSPKSLANFGKVERHGAIVLEFLNDRDGGPVRVRAGERWMGIAFQAKLER